MSGVLAVLFAFASALSVSANGFRLGGQDAFATARGGAVVATADNASAVYYNPAGITQLEGFNFRGGLYGLYYDPTFTPPPPKNTNTFHVKNQWAAVPQVFATYTPKDWPVSFGLGLYSPYGGNMELATGYRLSQRRHQRFADVCDDQSGGGAGAGARSLNCRRGDGELCGHGNGHRALLPPKCPTNYFRFKGNGWSAGYNVGSALATAPEGFAGRDLPQLGNGSFGRPNGIRAISTSQAWALPGHESGRTSGLYVPLDCGAWDLVPAYAQMESGV